MGTAVRSVGRGNVYGQKDRRCWCGSSVRHSGGYSLLTGTVALRACGQVFTAQEPEGVGPDKYDETAAAMIAQLKYGAGTAVLPAGTTGKPVGHPAAGGPRSGRSPKKLRR